MSCFTLTARAVPPVVCLMMVLGAVGGAQAQGKQQCLVNGDFSCDLQKDRTVLRSELWSGKCEPSQWDSLPPEAFPIEPGLRDGRKVSLLKPGPHAPVNFLNGICQVHKQEGTDLDQGIANRDLGISEFQKAQTQELMASQRNLASLFEGLLHCRQLSALKKKYPNDLEKRPESNKRFCLHRGMAKASFTYVNWARVELRYEGAPLSLENHVEEMAQCYAESLHEGYDAMCDIVPALSDEDAQTAATDAATQVLDSYFGPRKQESSSDTDTGASPLKAMLERKLQMANASLEGSETMFAGLESKNELLTDSYQSLGEQYCTPRTDEDRRLPCKGPIPTRVSGLHAAYERAVLEAQQVIGFVNQWIRGLFEDKGHDVRRDLTQSAERLSATLKDDVPPRLRKLEKVKHDLAVLSDTQANTKAVLSTCGVYFCELRQRNKNRFLKACDELVPGTGRKLSESNKLCAPEAEKTFLSEDAGASAFGVCKAAGFPIELMTGPPPATNVTKWVNDCMARFHP